MGGRVRNAALMTACLLVAVASSGCAAQAESRSAVDAKAGVEGAVVVQGKCSMCHTLDRIDAVSYDAAKWEETIARMQRNGLVITAEEKQAAIEYLTNR